jgi:hypothetical protein
LCIVREWKTAELLARLQNRAHKGKEGTVDHSALGRIGLGTACKEETSRRKNGSIKNSGEKKLCLWVEENCIFPEKYL